MGRHRPLETVRGRGPSRPRTRPPGPPPSAAAAPVAGDVADAGEAGRPAIGRDRGRVDALAADQRDAPRPVRAGAQRREGVVEDERLAPGDRGARARSSEPESSGSRRRRGCRRRSARPAGVARPARRRAPPTSRARRSHARFEAHGLVRDRSGRGRRRGASPSRPTRATSALELPPSTARTAGLNGPGPSRRRRSWQSAATPWAPGTSAARRSRTNSAPLARSPVDDRRQRVERAGRPGVEQDDGTVAGLRNEPQGIGGQDRRPVRCGSQSSRTTCCPTLR